MVIWQLCARLEKSSDLLTVNLGTGIGYSVLDVVNAFSNESGIEIAYEIMPRRAGDVAMNYADPALAKILLGWTATRNLAQMCADTWRWQSQNLQGYKTE